MNAYLDSFEKSQDIKFLLYALRAALTANLMVRTKAYVLRLSDLFAMYPESKIRELASAKRARLEFDAIDETMAEIQVLQRQTADLIPTFRPSSRRNASRMKELNQYLVSLRLQYMFSSNMQIDLR